MLAISFSFYFMLFPGRTAVQLEKLDTELLADRSLTSYQTRIICNSQLTQEACGRTEATNQASRPWSGVKMLLLFSILSIYIKTTVSMAVAVSHCNDSSINKLWQ